MTKSNISGIYLGDLNNPYGRKPFPYNMMELRHYLSETQKTMQQLTKEEMDKFLVKS